MLKILICHGWKGYPEENWFQWLKGELELLGHKVVVPQFPDPEYPNLNDWLTELKNHLKDEEEYILIGHSLGGYLVIKSIENFNFKIKRAYLIGSFLRKLNIPELEKFFETELDMNKIKNREIDIRAYNSENDPYVPAEFNSDWESINAKLILKKDAQHFNADAGFTKIDFLLEDIKSERW